MTSHTNCTQLAVSGHTVLSKTMRCLGGMSMFRTFPQTHYACFAPFDSGIIFFFLKQNCFRHAVFTLSPSSPEICQAPQTAFASRPGPVSRPGPRAHRAAQAVTLQRKSEDTPWRGGSRREMIIFHCQVLLPFQQDQRNCLAIDTFSALPAWQHFPIGVVFQSLLYRFVYFKDKRSSACLTYRPGTSPKKLKL